MTFTLTNRSTPRLAIKTLLDAALVGTGKYCVTSFSAQPNENELGSKSPVYWISSRMSTNDRRTVGQTALRDFEYLVQVAIRTDTLTNIAGVEARLDLIEKTISETLLDTETILTANGWRAVEMLPQGTGYMVIGGNEYRTEIFSVIVKVND